MLQLLPSLTKLFQHTSQTSIMSSSVGLGVPIPKMLRKSLPISAVERIALPLKHPEYLLYLHYSYFLCVP